VPTTLDDIIFESMMCIRSIYIAVGNVSSYEVLTSLHAPLYFMQRYASTEEKVRFMVF
jgi:hypothetical protein